MTTGLVGSEMCIRDNTHTHTPSRTVSSLLSPLCRCAVSAGDAGDPRGVVVVQAGLGASEDPDPDQHGVAAETPGQFAGLATS